MEDGGYEDDERSGRGRRRGWDYSSEEREKAFRRAKGESRKGVEGEYKDNGGRKTVDPGSRMEDGGSRFEKGERRLENV